MVVEQDVEMRTLILSAGMQRSASTWLYNAVRIALLRCGDIDLGCGWVRDYKSFKHHDVVLVKIHEYQEAVASAAQFVTYSFRDVRDVLASMKRRFGVGPSIRVVDQLIRQDALWRARADFVMRYEDFIESAAGELESLLGSMGLGSLDAEEILREIDALAEASSQAGEGAYDAQNLFLKGHVTDGRHGAWEGDLEALLVREIERRYDWWFYENGYDCALSR